MDLLPDLALLELFSLLSAEERFSTLRLVCRRWKQVVEFQSQNDLVVYQNEHPFKCRWPSDNRQIDLLHTVGKRFFDFFLANGYCKQIKRLFLRQIDWNSIERKSLMKCLGQLEEISIDQTTSYYPIENGNWTLDLDGFSLPSLRVFSVKQRFAGSLEPKKANIYAPKLEKLIIWDLSFTAGRQEGLRISLSHPEQLRSLQCQQIDKETRAFKNLEQLTANYVRRDFDLSKHRKLKRLDLCLPRFEMLPWEDPSNYHETIEWLVEQKNELKLDHLEITNVGSRDHLPGYAYKRGSPETFSFVGYSDLDRLARNCTIDYLPWGIHFVPMFNHLESFPCLSRLSIDSVTLYEYHKPDPNIVIKFLVQIGGVQYLQISKCAFSGEFYDQLSTVPCISFLSVFGPLPITDFKFIYRAKFLHRIRLELERFALDSFWLAFKKAKITNFYILINGGTYERQIVFKRENTRIDLISYSSGDIPFNCLEEAFAIAKKRCDFPFQED